MIAGDIPKKPEPLPKFPGGRDAARLMAAALASADPRDRLVVELLARTGMRRRGLRIGGPPARLKLSAFVGDGGVVKARAGPAEAGPG